MGEEEKKPEEEKMGEKKVEDAAQQKTEEPKSDNPAAAEKKNSDESKDPTPAPPPPPQEIVLKVYMHCEGCAKKVRRCLKGFEGVEDIFTDCKNHKVVVKGEKADPVKVFERIQKKSNRKVELLSPIPAPPPAAAVEETKKTEEIEETPKPEEKKKTEEVITVVLKVHMHCEACAQEIKRRILKMKGVENVEPDLGNSQVSVKGIFVPEKLLDYVHKKTGKQAQIVKQEPSEKKEESEKADEEKKKTDGEEEKKGGDDVAKEEAPADGGGGDAVKALEMKKNEFYYYNNPQIHQIYPQNQRYPNEGFVYPNYPSQMFSDENPNACSLM